MSLVALLVFLVIFLIVFGTIFWATQELGEAFKIPAPIVVAIRVILVIVGLVFLLQRFGVGEGTILQLR